MFRNYLLSTLRYFRRNKLFTIVNAAGLAVGMTASIAICCIIGYHHSFDTFEPGRDKMYRITSQVQLTGASFLSWGVSYPLIDEIKAHVPGVKAIAPTIHYGYNNKVTSLQKGISRTFFKQDDLVFTDSSYFSNIPYHWLAGTIGASLNTPFSVVLTESKAKLYFPSLSSSNVLGLHLVLGDSLTFVITGVVEDLAKPSDFISRVFFSRATLSSNALKNRLGLTDWTNVSSDVQCLLTLDELTPPTAVERALDDIEQRHMTAKGTSAVCHLQSLSDIHFNESLDGKVKRSTLNSLALIASFLLLMACINFVNLSTASLTDRAKEMGIRKLLGSSKWQVIGQCFTVSFLLSAAACGIALGLTPLVLLAFKDFLPQDFHLLAVDPIWMIGYATGVTLAVSFVTCLYPAWLNTRLSLARVLKGQLSSLSAGSGGLRKGLTLFQFVLADAMIAATFVVARQVNFALDRDLGFRKTAIVNIRLPADSGSDPGKKVSFLRSLQKYPELALSALGSMAPVAEGDAAMAFHYEGDRRSVDLLAGLRTGDSNYLQVFGLRLLAGRLPGGSANALLIDASFAAGLGFSTPGMAVNQYLQTGEKKKVRIAGVLADFTTGRQSNGIAPAVFYLDTGSSTYVHVLLNPNNASGSTWRKAISDIREAYQAVYPNLEFDYHFFDQEVADLFEEDQRLFRLLEWSAGLSLFIGCLGIAGLSLFIANRRGTEIAIRKVLGSSVRRIIFLLTGEFFRLQLLGFLISIPIVWWWASSWRNAFAHRAALTWWIMSSGGAVMAINATLILGLISNKFARANPAAVLRGD